MGRVWPKRKNGKESPERQYNKTDDQPELLFRQPPEAAEWYGSQREQLVWTVRDLTIPLRLNRVATGDVIVDRNPEVGDDVIDNPVARQGILVAVTRVCCCSHGFHFLLHYNPMVPHTDI